MPSIEEYKSHARSAFQSKQYKKAAKIYRDAIALHANEPVLYSNRAQCFINLQDWPRALADAQSGLQHAPGPSIKIKLLFRKGVACKNLNQTSEAVKSFREVLALDPANSSAQAELDGLAVDDSLSEHSVKKQKQTGSTNVPVELVDRLPDEFEDIVNPPLEIPRSEPSNPSLVSKLSEELFGNKSFPVDEPEPQPKYTSSTDFSLLPSMHHLSGLKSLAPEKKKDAYKFVINLDNTVLEGLFSLSGVDVEFFDFFLEACQSVLSQEVTPQTLAQITQKLECLSKCPRYLLTLQMCDSTQLNNMLGILKASGVESERLQQLLGSPTAV